jgi:hypothetical protein
MPDKELGDATLNQQVRALFSGCRPDQRRTSISINRSAASEIIRATDRRRRSSPVPPLEDKYEPGPAWRTVGNYRTGRTTSRRPTPTGCRAARPSAWPSLAPLAPRPSILLMASHSARGVPVVHCAVHAESGDHWISGSFAPPVALAKEFLWPSCSAQKRQYRRCFSPELVDRVVLPSRSNSRRDRIFLCPC